MAKKKAPASEIEVQSTIGNPLAVFDELKAVIATFTAPLRGITVMDDESATKAIDAAKSIKAYLKQADDRRKEIVGPLNDKVREINDYVKDLTRALVEADDHVRRQLSAHAERQEKIRQAELRRIDEERREAERQARIKREQDEAEFIAAAQAKAEEEAQVRAMFGTHDPDELERINERESERLEAELRAKQMEFDQAEAVKAVEFKQREFDAERVQIRNTRTTLRCRVVDISLVPKEFLIIEVNEKAAVAAAKAGVKISGLEFYEDFNVAIGRNTYVPKKLERISG